MSNPEANPAEIDCGGPAEAASENQPTVELIEHRDVPLGGHRAIVVRRTLPSRERTMIGAWCFVDHFGSLDGEPEPMHVPPHPHTGLQTVTWLLEGAIEHRDSLGTHAQVRPGSVNLMTSGRGISHSEDSLSDDDPLHGVQLWVALPQDSRFAVPAFERWTPQPVDVGGGRATVFIGEAVFEAVEKQPAAAPVDVFTPLLGADIAIEPDAEVVVRAAEGFEYGVLNTGGQLDVHGTDVPRGSLAYLAPGQGRIVIRAGSDGARVILLGGEPFGEKIVMWWNFIGRTHDEVVESRETWQSEIAAGGGDQFGRFPYDGEPLPAPALPHVRLRSRG